MSAYLKIYPIKGIQFYKRYSDGAVFPELESNEDYQNYLAWLAEPVEPPNVPDIEPEPPKQPALWSKLKIRRQLRALGKEQTFDNLLALYQFTSFWTDAEYIAENYPEVQQLLPALPTALDLTQQQIDDILENSLL